MLTNVTVPELRRSPLWTCRQSNETRDDRSATCWKCGRSREGNLPAEHQPRSVRRPLPFNPELPRHCLYCGSEQVLPGKISVPSGGFQFSPRNTRFFTLSLSSPFIRVNQKGQICLNCGL